MPWHLQLIRIPPRHDLDRPRLSDIEKARRFSRHVERRKRRALQPRGH